MALKEEKRLYQEGLKALKEKDYNKAIECFEKSSESGYFFSTYNLGCMYYFGDGVKEDHKKSFD